MAEAHSPGDLAMSINQIRRMDGRVKIPVSIVIGKGDFYMIVVPTDGVIEEIQNHTSEGAVRLQAQIELEREFSAFMEENRFGDIYQAAGPFIERKAHKRKLGYYVGQITNGVMKRVV